MNFNDYYNINVQFIIICCTIRKLQKMVLFSSETNALIRKSNSEWSRTKLSELLVDKDIGIQVI